VGLSISVGYLAFLSREDPEGVAGLREEFAQINRVLEANGLPSHVEPEQLPELIDRSDLHGMPYSWLHYLRRAVAYARQQPEEFAPLTAGEDPSEDDVIEEEQEVFMDSHLVCHSDCDGDYVPVDFDELLWGEDNVPGGILGSSQRALAEVLLAAPLLGIDLIDGGPTKTIIDTIRGEDRTHPLCIERKVWLCLYEKFRLSVEHKTAVVFG
jgi:hypothetical protein